MRFGLMKKPKVHNDTLRVPMGQQELMKMRKYLTSQDEFFICGSHSLTWPKERTKFILAEKCKFWPGLFGQEYLMTPSEIARTELMRQFPNLKRVGWPSKCIKLFNIGAPMLFTGQFEGHGFYIDLKSAYWSFYRQLPLNVLHPRGWPSRTLMLSPVAEILKEDKAARNSVMGIIRSRSVVAYKGKKLIKLSTKNRFLSPPLWATVLDCLHELAYFAKSVGAIYINTDGYIFKDEAGYSAMVELLERQAISYHSKTGFAQIAGWNSYTVGDKTTKNFEPHVSRGNYPFDTILPKEGLKTIKWIQKHSYN